jgi:hypothetical protein
MVVDHADCLHEGVNNGGADEAEAVFFENMPLYVPSSVSLPIDINAFSF